MPNMSVNDWLLVNDGIYSINTVRDDIERRKRLLQILRRLIPFYCASFYHVDMTKDNMLVNPVYIDLPEEKELLYNKYYYKVDYSRQLYYLSYSIIYRETDIIKNREKTEYYNDYLQPKTKVHFVVNVNFANQTGLLGHISLTRNKEQGEFTERELFILRLLEPHITNRLFQEKQQYNALISESAVGRIANKYRLTNREREIVSLMLQGLNNSEISNNLFISLGTVKKHINNIFRKIGVKNRTQLFNLFIN